MCLASFFLCFRVWFICIYIYIYLDIYTAHAFKTIYNKTHYITVTLLLLSVWNNNLDFHLEEEKKNIILSYRYVYNMKTENRSFIQP